MWRWFGATIALNLDLQGAFELMQLISPAAPKGLDREVEHSHKILGKQAKAKDMLDGLKQFKRFSPKPKGRVRSEMKDSPHHLQGLARAARER